MCIMKLEEYYSLNKVFLSLSVILDTIFKLRFLPIHHSITLKKIKLPVDILMIWYLECGTDMSISLDFMGVQSMGFVPFSYYPVRFVPNDLHDSAKDYSGTLKLYNHYFHFWYIWCATDKIVEVQLLSSIAFSNIGLQLWHSVRIRNEWKIEVQLV